METHYNMFVRTREEVLEKLDQLTGTQFEELIAALFRERGYTAVVCGGSGDKGIDVILERAGVRSVVQCKRWIGIVAPSTVREFIGAVWGSGAEGGFFITTADITISARDAASQPPVPITLMSGTELVHWIEEGCKTEWEKRVEAAAEAKAAEAKVAADRERMERQQHLNTDERLEWEDVNAERLKRERPEWRRWRGPTGR